MQLLEEIRKRRHLGRVIAEFHPGRNGDPGSRVDTFLPLAQHHGLRAQADSLRLVSRAEAIAIATRVLCQDLAYHHEVMPLEAAERLASGFIRLFAEPALFATNGIFSRDTVGRETLIEWQPLSACELDTGVMGISASGSGLLWVEDDD